MLDAIRAHQEGVVLVTEVFGRLDTLDARLAELRENDAELKRLIVEQGAEIRALRARLDEDH
jgi:hypothetical protein